MNNIQKEKRKILMEENMQIDYVDTRYLDFAKSIFTFEFS